MTSDDDENGSKKDPRGQPIDCDVQDISMVPQEIRKLIIEAFPLKQRRNYELSAGGAYIRERIAEGDFAGADDYQKRWAAALRKTIEGNEARAAKAAKAAKAETACSNGRRESQHWFWVDEDHR